MTIPPPGTKPHFWIDNVLFFGTLTALIGLCWYGYHRITENEARIEAKAQEWREYTVGSQPMRVCLDGLYVMRHRDGHLYVWQTNFKFAPEVTPAEACQ